MLRFKVITLKSDVCNRCDEYEMYGSNRNKRHFSWSDGYCRT